MSIFQHYRGGSYYRDDELQKIKNPNWASSQAQYDQYYRDVTQKAENRAAAEKAALEAIFTGRVSGDSGSDVRLSGMSRFAGTAGFGGMAGKAGMAGKSGGIASLVRGYEQGGTVTPGDPLLTRSIYIEQKEKTKPKTGGPTPFIRQNPIQVEARGPGIETFIGALFGSKTQPNTANISQEEIDQRLLDQAGYTPSLTEKEKQEIIDAGNRRLRGFGVLSLLIRDNDGQIIGNRSRDEFHAINIKREEDKKRSRALSGLKQEVAKNQELMQGRVSNPLSDKQQLFNRQGPKYNLVQPTSTTNIQAPDFSADREAFEAKLLENYQAPSVLNETQAETHRQDFLKREKERLQGMRDSGLQTGIPYFDLDIPTIQNLGNKTYNPYTGEYVENPNASGIPSLVNQGLVRNKIF